VKIGTEAERRITKPLTEQPEDPPVASRGITDTRRSCHRIERGGEQVTSGRLWSEDCATGAPGHHDPAR
jgi:hypothetical protein